MLDIPRQHIGPWAKEVIDACSTSMVDRARAGVGFQNLFLSGDAEGKQATFPKTYAHIDNVASFLYSPIDLRFSVEPYGKPGPIARAKAAVCSYELNSQIRGQHLDTMAEQAVLWSLVKGKTFIKLKYTRAGLGGDLIQPERMGVFNESVNSLDEQDAFFMRTYMTPGKFRSLVRDYPDANELINRVSKNISLAEKDPADARWNQAIMQIVTGGMQPFKAGGGDTGPAVKASVDWLSNARPVLAANVMQSLIPVDELWIKNWAEDDWVTMQVAGGDVMIFGRQAQMNLFATAYDPTTKVRRIGGHSDNPLDGEHPFCDFCPNPIDEYFWGRSELAGVALLQEGLNRRLDGIGALLRRQEDPPRFLKGFAGSASKAKSILSRPGGYLTDSGPTAEIKDLAPTIAQGLYDDVHEKERMFNEMAGFPPVMQGRGEAGVRAQGHAEVLTQNAAPRFMDRALLIERQIAEMGSLGWKLIQAKNTRQLIAWVPPNVKGIEIDKMAPDTVEALEPPAPGMRPIAFLASQVPDDWRVDVDSHSGSPAFSHLTKQDLFDLHKRGAISNVELIEGSHVPHSERLEAEQEARDIAHDQLVAEHPELAFPHGKKKAG